MGSWQGSIGLETEGGGWSVYYSEKKNNNKKQTSLKRIYPG